MKTVSDSQTQAPIDWRPDPFPEPRTIPGGWDVSVLLVMTREPKEATVTCFTPPLDLGRTGRGAGAGINGDAAR